MSENFSITNDLVNKTANFFAISENDTIAKKGGKVFGKALSNMALVVVGAIETVIFAILIALSSPLNLFAHTQPTFKNLKDRLEFAANGTVRAAKNIAKNIKIELPKIEIQADISGFNRSKTAVLALSTFALLIGGAYGAFNHPTTIQGWASIAKKYMFGEPTFKEVLKNYATTFLTNI